MRFTSSGTGLDLGAHDETRRRVIDHWELTLRIRATDHDCVQMTMPDC